jgi:acetyl esterase/lipase
MNIKIYEIKAKENIDKIKPAVIHCHWGGAVAVNAKDVSLLYMKTVLDNDIVFYNIDYRLGPE